jgi:hypothetical protein
MQTRPVSVFDSEQSKDTKYNSIMEFIRLNIYDSSEFNPTVEFINDACHKLSIEPRELYLSIFTFCMDHGIPISIGGDHE